MTNGYNFYLAGNLLPITPSSLTITINNQNATMVTVNDNEINFLKSPKLIDIKFTARFPMRKYPYIKTFKSFDEYFNVIKKLKENKEPFSFIVTRSTPSGIPTWDTNLTVSLEDFILKEDTENGDDVLIDFNLKQYKKFETKQLQIKNDTIQLSPTNNATQNQQRVTKPITQTTYKIKSGDTLMGISKLHFNDTSKWQDIYKLNQTIIENEAKKRGKASSSNGHWIFPGVEIVLPASN